MTPSPKRFTEMNYVEIRELVLLEMERLKTQSAVATKCDVSTASINLIINEKWNGVKDGIWRKVAAALDYRPDGWVTVETADTRLLFDVFDDAKDYRFWMAVSSPAGSSKTTSAKAYASTKASKYVYYLECERWHKKTFVYKLANSLGISAVWTDSPDTMLDKVISFFQKQADRKPLLILDQFDKLHENSISTLIPLFNGCDDKMAVVIMGVGHLKKIFQSNVSRNKMFWDELESRFARTYITTYGVSKKEVALIARANGLNESDAIRQVWDECNPTQITYEGRTLKVVKDMRLLKRRIQVKILHMRRQKRNMPEMPAEKVAV